MAVFQRWNLLFFSPWNTRNCMVNLGKIMGNLGEIYMFNKSEKDILGIWLWEFITGNGIWKQHKISKIGESKVGATDWLAIWHLPEPRDAIWPYGWSTSVSHGMAAYPMENHPSDPFQHDFPVPNHPNHHPIAVISPTFREVRYGKITWEHSEKKKKHISTAAEATLLSNLSTLDSNFKLRPQLTIELRRSYQALNQHHPTNQLRTILPYVTPDLSRLGPSNMSFGNG